jgi:hypothetical protein
LACQSKLLSKKDSRARWRELRDLVNAWDPIGLIELGSPPDEYDCVVESIMRLLEEGASTAQITEYVLKELPDHFGSPVLESSAKDFAMRASHWFSTRWLPPSRATSEGQSVYRLSLDRRAKAARASVTAGCNSGSAWAHSSSTLA